MYTVFRCPHCKDTIRYSPGPEMMRKIAKKTNNGKPVCFCITCHHCPNTLILNPATGEAVEMSIELIERLGVGTILFEDSTLITGPFIYAKNEKKVEKLTYEGRRLMAIDVKRAEEKFREALRYRRNDARTLHNIGLCRLKMGDVEAAAGCFGKALNFDRSLLGSWNNLGTCLVMLGKLEKADKCFDDALEIDPDYPKFYLGKANVANMRQDYRKGREFLKKALEKDPSYEPAAEALRRLSELESE